MILELKFQIRHKRITLNPILLIGCFFLCLQTAFAQQGIGTDLPSKAAALEIKSVHRGLLIPRVELTALNNFAPIKGDNGTSSEVNSLLVYNTKTVSVEDEAIITPGYYYWTTAGGGKWNRLVNLEDLDNLLIEPWQVQETGEKATDNEQNIYQKGNVAIGKAYDVDSIVFRDITLDVKGTLRAGDFSDGYGTIGDNSIGFGENVVAEGKNSMAIGNYSRAIGDRSFAGAGWTNINDSVSAMGINSFAFGRKTRAEGDYSVAIGREAYVYDTIPGQHPYYGLAVGYKVQAWGNSSISLGRENKSKANYAITIGKDINSETVYQTVLGRFNEDIPGINGQSLTQWKLEDPLFIIGNGIKSGNDTIRSNAITLLKNSKLGLGISGKPTVQLDIGNENGDGEGKVKIHELPTTTPSTTETYKHVVVVENGTDAGVLKAIDFSSPQFFYMPSYPMPLDSSMADGVYATHAETTFTVDLHKIYSHQFGLSQANSTSSAGSTHELPVLGKTQLIYNITYYDAAVFTNVSVNANGELTYKILNNADAVSARTYMNIVFEVK